MERLVKDLLRLARLDARQEALEMARCDVRQIFSGVIADLAPAIEAKRQRVAIDVPPDAAQVDGDPAKLHDIVRNLVENAVNYSPDGADVTLAAARVERRSTRSPSPIPGPGFRRRIWRGCSSGSIAWTSRARGPAAPGSAWRSSSISWSCTAAKRARRMPPPAAPCLP